MTYIKRKRQMNIKIDREMENIEDFIILRYKEHDIVREKETDEYRDR